MNIHLNDFDLTLSSEMTLEQIIKQLQPLVDKYFVVEDGTILHIFDNETEFPTELQLESIDVNGVHFYRQISTQSLFAFFRKWSPTPVVVVEEVPQPQENDWTFSIP